MENTPNENLMKLAYAKQVRDAEEKANGIKTQSIVVKTRDIKENTDYDNKSADNNYYDAQEEINTQREVQHYYSKRIEVMKVAQSGGRGIAEAEKDLAADRNDLAYMGAHDIKSRTALPYQVLVANGARAELRRQRHKHDSLSATTYEARELIASRQLSLSDFKDHTTLEAALYKSNASAGLRSKILANSDKVYANIATRDTLLEFSSKNNDFFSKKEMELIDTGKLFNYGKVEQADKIIAKYFSRHENEIVRKANVTRLSKKNLDRLIKQSDKIGLSKTDIGLLKEVKNNKKIKELKSRSRSKSGIRNKNYIRKLREQTSSDDLGNAGLNDVQKIGSGAMLVKDIAKFNLKTVAWIDNHTLKIKDHTVHKYQEIRNKYKHTRTQERTVANKRTAQAKPEKQNNKAAPNKQQNSLGKAKKQKASANKKKSKSKKNKPVNKKKTFAGRILDVIKAPGEAISRGINLYDIIKSKISGFIFGGVAILCLVYVLCLGLGSVFWSGGGIDYSVIGKIPLVDEDDLYDMIDYVKEMESGTYDEAEKIGTTLPSGVTVDCNTPLYRYGSLNTSIPTVDIWHNKTSDPVTSGYRIYYVDSNGNVISNYQGVTKQVICIATALLYNNLPQGNGALLENEDFAALLQDIYNIIMPGVFSEEGDTYYCSYGCDVIQYKCNDSKFYESDVIKYSPVPYSEDGCDSIIEYHEKSEMSECDNYSTTEYYCTGDISDCTNKQTSTSYCLPGPSTNPGSCTNYTSHVLPGHPPYTIYVCNGHPYDVCGGHTEKECLGHEIGICNGHECRICYGHKDIDIYIPIITFDELIEASKTNVGVTYTSPTNGITHQTESLNNIINNNSSLLKDYINSSDTEEVLEAYNTYLEQDWEEIFGISSSDLLPLGG